VHPHEYEYLETILAFKKYAILDKIKEKDRAKFKKKKTEEVVENPDIVEKPQEHLKSEISPLEEVINHRKVSFIDTEKQLDALSQELQQSSLIGVDTEYFMEDKQSHIGFICLIQLSTVKQDYIIDCIKLYQLISTYLGPIFLSQDIVKVFHSDTLPDAALLADVAGVIVIGKHSDNEIAWLDEHCRHVVFADFVPSSDRFDCVHSDLVTATHKVLDTLHHLDYERIAFIGSYEHLNGETQHFGERRCKAYIDWQTARDTFDAELLVLGESCDSGQNLRLETGYELARQLLSRRPLPDIILTANDNMAIGTYRAAREAGLSIPDDVAIVSFNDIPVAQFLTPPLSTVKIHGEHIGETAVNLLLERLGGRSYAKMV
ncbi:MAG: hypothetical protein EOP06_27505, partial [Proteobacteria bacterium]